jgi:hypothetical protein
MCDTLRLWKDERKAPNATVPMESKKNKPKMNLEINQRKALFTNVIDYFSTPVQQK